MSASEPPRPVGTPAEGADQPSTLAPPQAPGQVLSPAGVATDRPAQTSIAGLRAELEADIRRIESEDGEIDMLMEQVLAEIERHEARRLKMETGLETLESSAAPNYEEIGRARDDLLALTRREFLFDSQRQVLQGKQRGLARFLQRLVEIDTSLSSLGDQSTRPAPVASAGLRPLAVAAGSSGVTAPGTSQPALQMRSEEDLRRNIVRQLHDGPAQSMANIGLQAEIVERLVKAHDERSITELESLRLLVQKALDSTKAFIFDVRPMVLDDLGLGPTIRRSASDRGRRAGINVEFDSEGLEDRIDSDLESAVFRSVDEAIADYLALGPPSVMVRLDWTERELIATVEGTWARIAQDAGGGQPSAPARPGDTPPVLLAMMEEKRSQDREAHAASRSLSPERIGEISNRANALGMLLTMRDDGQVMELVAPITR